MVSKVGMLASVIVSYHSLLLELLSVESNIPFPFVSCMISSSDSMSFIFTVNRGVQAGSVKVKARVAKFN